MKTRREFLSDAVVTLLLVPVVKGCTSGTTPSDGGGGGGDGGTGCSGVSSQSTAELGHAHSLCVPAGDLTNPPAGGATYTTGFGGGHTHRVTLSQSDLQTINSGGVVSVTSSVDSGHTHDYTIQKPDGG